MAILNRKKPLGALMHASSGYWSVAKNTESGKHSPEAPSARPGTCLAGMENHSGEVSTWFNSACSPETGRSSSPLRDVFRVFQVDVVFRIHRTDSQWELPEWQLDLNLARNPVSCFSLITWKRFGEVSFFSSSSEGGNQTQMGSYLMKSVNITPFLPLDSQYF